MEEVCDLIAKNWNVGFDTLYVQHNIDDDLKKVNSTDSNMEYVITQLNIYIGDDITELLSDEDEASVSFKYKDVDISIHEYYNSRDYGYWVVYIS